LGKSSFSLPLLVVEFFQLVARAKLTREDVNKIRKLLKEGHDSLELAKYLWGQQINNLQTGKISLYSKIYSHQDEKQNNQKDLPLPAVPGSEQDRGAGHRRQTP